MNALHGVIGTIIAVAVVFAAFNLGALKAQQDVKRMCEQYQVVDLPMTGSVFYCSREPR